MELLSDILAQMENNDDDFSIPTIIEKRIRSSKVSSRRYDIIGHRIGNDDIIRRNVPANQANKVRAEMRRNGCHAVDKIEVFTKVENGMTGEKEILTFTEKNYVPLLEGSIPGNPTISDKQIEDERAQRIANRFHFESRRDNSSEYRSDSHNVILYDKRTGKAIYYGSQEGAVFFLLNGKIALHNIVSYLPSKMVAKLNKGK